MALVIDGNTVRHILSGRPHLPKQRAGNRYLLHCAGHRGHPGKRPRRVHRKDLAGIASAKGCYPAVRADQQRTCDLRPFNQRAAGTLITRLVYQRHFITPLSRQPFIPQGTGGLHCQVIDGHAGNPKRIALGHGQGIQVIVVDGKLQVPGHGMQQLFVQRHISGASIVTKPQYISNGNLNHACAIRHIWRFLPGIRVHFYCVKAANKKTMINGQWLNPFRFTPKPHDPSRHCADNYTHSRLKPPAAHAPIAIQSTCREVPKLPPTMIFAPLVLL